MHVYYVLVFVINAWHLHTGMYGYAHTDRDWSAQKNIHLMQYNNIIAKFNHP